MNQSKDDSTGIVGFIVVLVIVGGIIFAINKNWDSIVHIIGGLAVGGVAVFILGASTDRNPKAQGIAFDIC
ncbi:MAG: hypothetical protein BWK78_05480 [Thiotrichaceae bacterium IS1]|nr:MAG: hypothetical protein BWK78_05480 [Thiotrichaceae bacterium IS1]